ncbi:MAG TPA: phosphomannomutase/phosphoglucomutase [Syntrophothermus lipocalidus]|uniref:phosphomannomutase/phosphoglucomutase n=1 Tax=Syntrophothermus sp. TaxID=2736299 RepID=UPI00179A7814|nr:phosphomannomutase/phosphoglucomutase [Syntrophothermus sp.]NSW84501.1 phosphomannomutase/phosphoglucomutase [Syntrophothermus sp.]HHV77564.1 phosphomannomutase/phosphoglucomutase [Syntrophothermus lipocalidus]
MNGNVFRQYDIRGIVDKELTDELVIGISRAFAVCADRRGFKEVLVGRDNRKSSPRYRDLVVEALQASGCRVVDIGTVVTPMFYFAARYLGIKAGLMITASHNPGDYNGFKVLLGETTIYGEEIQELRRMVERGESITEPGGRLEIADITKAYVDMIKDKVKLGPRKLSVVVDCGNGTASFFAPRVFRELGCNVYELYCESDPEFPNHHPDPVKPENCQDLIQKVQEMEADLGLGFDGDGDRLGVVDREGNIIWGDMLMILFWREILPKYPGCDCIVEVKCSQSLIDEIKRLGGRPLIYKTGHSLIKAKMKEIGAVFTGEMSGHMFFADEYYGYDDALYAAARLLRILSNSNQTITEMLADVPKYYATPEIRVHSSDEEKFRIVNEVLEHFKKKYEVIDVDGARILFPDGWGLVRASNTGPELILRCEGSTPRALENIKEELFGYLKNLGLEVDVGGLTS